MTYSIGFRAPTYQELVTQFLVYLQDHSALMGFIATRNPGPNLIRDISVCNVATGGSGAQKNQMGSSDVERFMGMYLTEPKHHVFFTPPSNPVIQQEFAYQVAESGAGTQPEKSNVVQRKIFF